MTPLKTNPAYAHLAYRKAITRRLSVYLHRSFLGDELGDPQEIIMSDEVFPIDQQVPVEEVQRYIEGLNEQVAELDLELGKFSLTRNILNDESQRAQGQARQHQSSRSSHRKKSRRARSNG